MFVISFSVHENKINRFRNLLPQALCISDNSFLEFCFKDVVFAQESRVRHCFSFYSEELVCLFQSHHEIFSRRHFNYPSLT